MATNESEVLIGTRIESNLNSVVKNDERKPEEPSEIIPTEEDIILMNFEPDMEIDNFQKSHSQIEMKPNKEKP